jgi:hypothetical protein
MAETVSVSLMLDKTLYAKTNTYGYKGTIDEKNKVTYAANAFIGTIYSWITKDDILYLVVYKSIYDYDNFNAILVPVFENNLKIPALAEAVALEKTKKKLEADEIKKDIIGPTQFYIEKYLPYLIGAFVIAIALPTIIKTFKNDK